MNRFAISFVASMLVLALVLPPAAASAQSYRYRRGVASTTPLDSGGTTPAVRQQISGWRQSNNFQTQIAALGTTPVASLPMPALFGVSPADLSPNFGDPRTNHPHMGEDIMAVKGTPIVSPTAAVVLRLEQGATEGNGIYTVNPGGETFVYYHLDRYAEGIVAGQVLAPGDIIGYVGNTGDAAGGAAHIHFEIHNSSGTPIDPFPRLTGEFTLEQKITYLFKILTQTSDSTALSHFLVTNFRGTFLNALAANISLPLPIIDAIASIPSTVALTRDLYQGKSGDDVRALQKVLNALGFTVALTGNGSSGNETAYFGPATKAAVIKFQIARGISPAVGYVGSITRAALAR